MNGLDTFAYTNRLRHLPPSQKLLFASVTLLIALISQPPVQMAIVLWLILWTVRYAGIPISFYRRLMTGVLIFLVTTLPVLVIEAVPVENMTQIAFDRLVGFDFFSWHFYLTWHGFGQAIHVFCRSLSCVSCLLFIAFTVPVGEVASVLEKLRCPTILIELMLLGYRFVFLLAEVAQQISTAQISRGGYRTRKRAMQSLSLLISQLLQRTIDRYYQLSLAVKARGFRHEFRFWQPRDYQFSPRYGREMAGGWIILLSWQGWLWMQ